MLENKENVRKNSKKIVIVLMALIMILGLYIESLAVTVTSIPGSRNNNSTI